MPYFIKNMRYDIKDSVIEQLLCMEDSSNWGLLPNMQFSVDRLDRERKRITDLLSDNGFYEFNKDYITYVADSVPGSNLVDLALVLHPFRGNGAVDSLHPRYKVRSVNFRGDASEDGKLKLKESVLKNNTILDFQVGSI